MTLYNTVFLSYEIIYIPEEVATTIIMMFELNNN